MGSRNLPRRRTIAAAVVLLIAAVFGVGALLDPSTHDPPETEHVDDDELIQPSENGSYLWPYTSAGESVSGRTLAINLIVHGPDDAVHRSLTDRGSLEFEREEADAGETDVEEATTEEATTEEPTPDESAVEVEEGLEWIDTHGAGRYSYVDATPRGGEAGWTREAYQLGAGTYLGQRLHVRAYTHPEENWTAIQAHTDYWDWFRLRHTVPDVREAGFEIEDDYIEEPYVAEVRREYHGIEGGRSDGWISVVELSSDVEGVDDGEGAESVEGVDDGDDGDGEEAGRVEATVGGAVVALLAALGLAGLLSGRGFLAPDTRWALDRGARALAREAIRRRRSILLGAVLAAIVLGVRVVGIALETSVSALHPKVIAAGLYPVLALGLPAAAARLSRGCDTAWAVACAGVGVGAAFVLDFGMVSVTFLPVRLVLHRFGLLLALALVAAGGAIGGDRGRQVLIAGLAAWTVGLALPLFEVI